MSLFVDLRHLKTSVTNLSEMVDKMSTSVTKDKICEESQQTSQKYESTLYGSPLFKPTLGFGVRFSQSQENVYQNMPSSRLRSHVSLPDLDKEDVIYQKSSASNTEKQPKIVEINNENDSDTSKPIIQISTENLGNWIAASTSKRPTFDDSGDTHPMDFLDEIRYYIKELNLATDKQLAFIISCLSGVPLMWARCFRTEFKDVETFYKAFEQEFWGPERQKSVLYDMKLGKYDELNSRISMSEYYLHKLSNYRHLTPPPSDLEIVYSLAAHFPTAVELELRLSQRPSLREAYRVLKRREGEATDFLPNYLFEMCDAYQRGHRPESARLRDTAPSASTPRSDKVTGTHTH